MQEHTANQRPISPAQIILGHHLRSTVPVPLSTFDHKWKDMGEGNEVPKDIGKRSLQPLSVGDQVWIQDPVTGKWKKMGLVIGAAGRNYPMEGFTGATSGRDEREHQRSAVTFSNEDSVHEFYFEDPPSTGDRNLVRRGHRIEGHIKVLEEGIDKYLSCILFNCQRCTNRWRHNLRMPRTIILVLDVDTVHCNKRRSKYCVH